MHSWIAFEIIQTGKLPPIQIYSQILKYLDVCGWLSRFFRSPNWLQFPSAAVLLLEQKGSTSHFWNPSLMPEKLSRMLEDILGHVLRILEASWKRPDYFREESKIMKISTFWCQKKSMLQLGFFYDAQTDTIDAFLDRAWPDLDRKIAPASIEFTDSEISWFFWTIFPTFWQAFLIWIVPAAVLRLELRKALRVIFDTPFWSELSLPLYYS